MGLRVAADGPVVPDAAVAAAAGATGAVAGEAVGVGIAVGDGAPPQPATRLNARSISVSEVDLLFMPSPIRSV